MQGCNNGWYKYQIHWFISNVTHKVFMNIVLELFEIVKWLIKTVEHFCNDFEKTILTNKYNNYTDFLVKLYLV